MKARRKRVKSPTASIFCRTCARPFRHNSAAPPESSARPLLPPDVDDERAAVISSSPRDKHGGAEHRCLTRMANQRSREALLIGSERCIAKGDPSATSCDETRFDRRTIAKWIRADALPQRNGAAPRTSSPRYFEEYLARRWAEGCVRGRRLFQEVKARGYTGSF